jgi:serine-type D-Ala-D-Ala carboxypeptidase
MTNKKNDNYFYELIKSGITSCISIALCKNDKLIYKCYLGEINANRRSNIGSVTKVFTGALLLKLTEQGKLTLTDPIKKFIPEYKFDNVTLLHVLTHTAGYTGKDGIPWPESKEKINDYFNWIYNTNLKYKPGEISEYWSYGYSIIMDVIQRITGLSLEEFGQEVLFKPLNMSKTTFDITKLKPEEYILPWDGKNIMANFKTIPPTGDIGLYTTAEDLVKFGNMVLNFGKFNNKKIFSKPCIDLMLHEVTGLKFMRTPNFWIKGSNDIFGCFGDFNSPSAIGHTGLSGCMLMIDPEYKTTIAIVSNSMVLHSDWKNYKRIINFLLSI